MLQGLVQEAGHRLFRYRRLSVSEACRTLQALQVAIRQCIQEVPENHLRRAEPKFHLQRLLPVPIYRRVVSVAQRLAFRAPLGSAAPRTGTVESAIHIAAQDVSRHTASARLYRLRANKAQRRHRLDLLCQVQEAKCRCPVCRSVEAQCPIQRRLCRIQQRAQCRAVLRVRAQVTQRRPIQLLRHRSEGTIREPVQVSAIHQ